DGGLGEVLRPARCRRRQCACASKQVGRMSTSGPFFEEVLADIRERRAQLLARAIGERFFDVLERELVAIGQSESLADMSQRMLATRMLEGPKQQRPKRGRKPRWSADESADLVELVEAGLKAMGLRRDRKKGVRLVIADI